MVMDLYGSLVRVIESNKNAHEQHRTTDAQYKAQCETTKKKINAFIGKKITKEQAAKLIEMM